MKVPSLHSTDELSQEKKWCSLVLSNIRYIYLLNWWNVQARIARINQDFLGCNQHKPNPS